MSDLHPTLPDDDVDDPSGGPSSGRWRRTAVWTVVLLVLAIGLSLALDTSLWPTVAAVVLGVVILRTGWFFLQSFATPPPEPPEPGKIRKVKLVYRCSICGTEVRMTAAPTEDPEPPRHCLEDMDLVAPID